MRCKKTVILLAVIIFLVSGVAAMINFKLNKPSNKPLNKPSESTSFNVDEVSLELGEFELDDYRWELENFPSSLSVGDVPDAKTAWLKAKDIWIEEYAPYNPFAHLEEIITVLYDARNECWLVKTKLRSDYLGATPRVILEKNGKVLAVWQG